MVKSKLKPQLKDAFEFAAQGIRNALVSDRNILLEKQYDETGTLSSLSSKDQQTIVFLDLMHKKLKSGAQTNQNIIAIIQHYMQEYEGKTVRFSMVEGNAKKGEKTHMNKIVKVEETDTTIKIIGVHPK